MTKSIGFDDFMKINIRAGTIIDVSDFPEARKPAFRLVIDFGEELGTRNSSAQITTHYDRASLLGRQVLAVINLPPRQIGPFLSEVLTLGFADEQGDIILASAERALPNGARLC